MKDLLPTPKKQEFLDLYMTLIASAVSDSNLKTELHHILPRSMGGSNEKSNVVHLTTAQHYEAHYLLWKAYSNQQMSCAFHLMTTNRADRRQLSVDEFVQLREDYRNSKKEYWKSLPEEKKEQHRKNSNPWANKTPEEKKVYKQKCNSWINKHEEELNSRKEKQSAKMSALYKGVGFGNKEDRIQAYKETVSKRTSEDRANLNYGNNRGTIWINDGASNKRQNSTDSISIGWVRGRIKQGTI
jgi:hypothetical protein